MVVVFSGDGLGVLYGRKNVNTDNDRNSSPKAFRRNIESKKVKTDEFHVRRCYVPTIP